jgi:hypothetical protein
MACLGDSTLGALMTCNEVVVMLMLEVARMASLAMIDMCSVLSTESGACRTQPQVFEILDLPSPHR